MIEIKPVSDRTDYKEVSPSSEILEMTDRGEKLGYIVIHTNGKTLYIEKMQCSEPILADGLIRSALSYGDNRMCDDAVAPIDENIKVFKKVGFFEDSGSLNIKISSVIHNCRH